MLTYATSVVSVLFYQVPKPIFHPGRVFFYSRQLGFILLMTE